MELQQISQELLILISIHFIKTNTISAYTKHALNHLQMTDRDIHKIMMADILKDRLTKPKTCQVCSKALYNFGNCQYCAEINLAEKDAKLYQKNVQEAKKWKLIL